MSLPYDDNYATENSVLNSGLTSKSINTNNYMNNNNKIIPNNL